VNSFVRFALSTALLFGVWNIAVARNYDVTYQASIDAPHHEIDVTIHLKGERLPSRLTFRTDPARHSDFKGDGKVTVQPGTVIWEPREPASTLHYRFKVDHKKDNGRFDALMQDDWAVFRGDDLVPSSAVTSSKSLDANATLQFVLPKDWSVATPYAKSGGDQTFNIENPDRRFQRPIGWIIVGKIGTRSERITGVETIVSAPVGDQARRQDMLSFLNWNLPQLIQVFPQFPKRLLIVSAGDPMWHGGLSGPGSLFIHTSRPLVSEDRTSTLLHELTHLALGIHGDNESDWIVEGLAEYYSIETLRRSGGIGQQRYEEAMARLGRWGKRAPDLFVDHSTGATTARAVLVFRDVDQEIREASKNHKSLDDVARLLADERGEVSLQILQDASRRIAGRALHTLERSELQKQY
jgi:predicted metalloprotease with PDZ domain